MRCGSVRAAICAMPALILTVASGQAAPEMIGRAVSIENVVVRSSSGGAVRLKTGDGVHFRDRIRARSQSRGQIEFLDSTKIVVGPGAQIVLDEFVYTPRGTVKSATVTALKGAFRFISGSSPSRAYHIRSPASTMGIQGTAFDMYVGSGGQTAVMILKGRIRVCDRAQRCRVLDNPCEMAVIDARRGFVEEGRGIEKPVIGSLSMAAAFPFLTGQRNLVSRFRVGGAPRCANILRRAGAAPSSPARAEAASAPAGPASGISGGPGNPGNNKGVGGAGESPGGGAFGGGDVGRGDTAGGGRGNGRGGGRGGGRP